MGVKLCIPYVKEITQFEGFKNRVLKGIFEPKKDKVIIRVTKSRRVRWE
jgi:hypothetical protein